VNLFTIGHSTHSLEQFLALLRLHSVVSLADVRRHPGSRRLPWFGSESLAGAWPGYVHAPELGGRRSRRPGSPNTGWDVAAFGGYADHMESGEFRSGLARLLALSPPVAIMCAEGNWWQCHRRLIADALTARGYQVLHIARDGATTEHELTPFAVVETGDPPRLTYPPQQLQLG
jgi:uncharacterized protein (DUF488 family)